MSDLGGLAFTVAVTGGIGSGKSEVASRFGELGAQIIDADRIARAVVAVGEPALEEIVTEFGAEVLTADGSLDRAALALRVFGDPAALARLNSIVHPRVAERTQALLAAAPADSIVVYDVPLLDEQAASQWDLVVVVSAAPAVRVERLMTRRGMTAGEARARIDSQPSAEEYLELADVVDLPFAARFTMPAHVQRVDHVAGASQSMRHRVHAFAACRRPMHEDDAAERRAQHSIGTARHQKHSTWRWQRVKRRW